MSAMEKSKTRITILIIVVALSLASYIFLNYAGATQTSGETIEQYEEGANFEQSNSKMSLPEIRLLKQVLETGKQLLPAS